MDKRKVAAKKRYEAAHDELLEAGENLLSNELLTELSLNSITNLTKISKTTIYEHFDSFNMFLAGVIGHVYKKMTTQYREKLQDDPKENIKTMFIDYREFLYKNFILGKNIYAAFVLLSDTDDFPEIDIYKELVEELNKLGLNNNEKNEFLKKFNFSIDDFRIDMANKNRTNINLLIHDLTLYLENY